MWLLENAEAFKAGQLAISHNTISRKHLTITVDNVEPGAAQQLTSRSKLTIEDLATKIGTVVNGQKIRGEKHVVVGDEADIVMGKCPDSFHLRWFPVAFTFSFTNKELRYQPLDSLKMRFEHLDIKLSIEYSVQHTTHVVSKKRNTAKGLQALIHGRHLVTETFLDAVIQAAEPPDPGDASRPSPLEQDFDQYWPDAMAHLPPRGGEPVSHPDSIYKPDAGRKDVFDGYTFIMYDKTQYSNLMAPITDGCGKAIIHTITPGEEQVDDFVRYVKTVAGEKGLGSFNDGSEGKGVVLVRYLPAKGDLIGWYTDFVTAVSLRLDHRPIEQNEFLEAILIKDACKLRRPLELESSMPSQETRSAEQPPPAAASSPPARNEQEPVLEPIEEAEQESAPRRGRGRKPIKRRFAGFADDDDTDMADSPPKPAKTADLAESEDEGGLFVSQDQHPIPEIDNGSQSRQSRQSRKRPAPGLQEDDLMEGLAPGFARFKRQRLENSHAFASPSPEPEPEEAPTKARPKKQNKELDILALAGRHREEEEARARAEKEYLATLPEDVDLAEIRRLTIVEEMPLRRRANAGRTLEQDIADGRWDPKWNGVKNFKKFRRRGEEHGRPSPRVIVPLTQVKNKEFGVGDNYWLEEETDQRKMAASTAASLPIPESASSASIAASSRPNQQGNTGRIAAPATDNSDDGDQGSLVPLSESGPRGTRSAKVTATQSQRTTTTQESQGRSEGQSEGRSKRLAPESAASEASKRPRRKAFEVADSEDSDDELKFRFGRRR
ncbi:hypothetical protein DCS_04578 [Drechmeria coniospora]|uniref:FHA domain-containing protein n=1 Tax=Drechmeria coniospora TaxID=98403 RepID=A0A151GKD8_DRECN|nr:hypothetical protein DCS_04578 [Drechmeria coniospora]KYK57567.1 hypothetical protein DCS_04578 [Drechmeria coniospora]